jgi:hypothetical protein
VTVDQLSGGLIAEVFCGVKIVNAGTYEGEFREWRDLGWSEGIEQRITWNTRKEVKVGYCRDLRGKC